jgi:hypothetical protein
MSQANFVASFCYWQTNHRALRIDMVSEDFIMFENDGVEVKPLFAYGIYSRLDILDVESIVLSNSHLIINLSIRFFLSDDMPEVTSFHIDIENMGTFGRGSFEDLAWLLGILYENNMEMISVVH